MNTVRLVTGEATPEAFATTAAMALEHIGNLLTFLDQRLGEMVMFDPEANTQEATIREALAVGGKVCRALVEDGAECGVSPAAARELWIALAEEVVRRQAPTP